jgi:transcriptional regulator with XRE-family HTH domain
MSSPWRSGYVDSVEAAHLVSAVGEPLRSARVAAGLTRRQLADLARVGLSTVERYEVGRTRPTRGTLSRLAGVLHAGDAAAAEAFVERLGRAAGPSMAGLPMVPVALAQQQVVAVLTEALARFGIDVADDQARAVVLDVIRDVVGVSDAGTPPDSPAALPAPGPGPSDARSDGGSVRNR